MFSELTPGLPILLGLPIVLVAAPLTASDSTQEIRPGRTVTVAEDGVELFLGQKIVAQLKRDMRMQVTIVRGNWIGGYVTLNGKKASGWVRRTEVKIAGEASADDEESDPGNAVSESIDFVTSEEIAKTAKLLDIKAIQAFSMLYRIALGQEKRDQQHKKAFEAAIDNITSQTLESAIALIKQDDDSKVPAFAALVCSYNHFMGKEGTFNRQAFNAALHNIRHEQVQKADRLIKCKEGRSEALGILLVCSSFFISDDGTFDKNAFNTALAAVTVEKMRSKMQQMKEPNRYAAFERVLKQHAK